MLQLMLFMIKFIDWVMHNNPMYSILSQKFGQISVNGPNQAKNDFFFFFSIAHLLASAMEKPVTSFSERIRAVLYIDVTTETKDLSRQVK